MDIIKAVIGPEAVERAQVNDLAMWLSAHQLARAISEHHNLDFADVWSELVRAPDEALIMLESVQGWVALSSYVSVSLGSPEAPPLVPYLH